MPSRPRKSLIIVISVLLLGISVFLIAAGLRGAGTHWFDSGTQTPGDTLTLYGNIDLREVQLAFNEPGRITGMPAQAGDTVEKGQLLASLDKRRYVADLKRAQASLNASKAALDRLLSGSRPQDIARLRAVVDADKAELEAKRLTYQRLVRLVRQKAGTQQNLDEARAAMQAATGHLKADQQALNLAIAGPRLEDIAQARASVAVEQAARDLAQIALDDTALYAPSSGVIRNRIMEPGDMASPSAAVYTLALTSPLWVRAYVDEADLGHIRLGLPASVNSDSFPGHSFKGWIGYISPTAEFTPKSVETTRVRSQLVYQVHVFVCNAQDRLRLGMPVTVHIALNAKPLENGKTPCAQPGT
ncbi:MAG: efflux RND transporter periplasmic adaptor subunit [Acidihalobacter sp.]|uniref:efflux RND transporter periplasmic adaptor subunit n=1 Tax=Acidihalobacter sp. TaxID=1872108 RepID=UPI00307F0744